MFKDTYMHGTRSVVASWERARIEDVRPELKPVFDRLEESVLDVTFEDTPKDIPMVLLYWFGTYMGDELAHANADEAEELFSNCGHLYVQRDWTGVKVWLMTDLVDMDSDLWEETEDAIKQLESLSDYPVLNDGRLSQYQRNTWEEAVSESIRLAEGSEEWEDEKTEFVREFLDNHYFGYAEPGYIAEAWIEEALTEWEER